MYPDTKLKRTVNQQIQKEVPLLVKEPSHNLTLVQKLHYISCISSDLHYDKLYQTQFYWL